MIKESKGSEVPLNNQFSTKSLETSQDMGDFMSELKSIKLEQPVGRYALVKMKAIQAAASKQEIL